MLLRRRRRAAAAAASLLRRRGGDTRSLLRGLLRGLERLSFLAVLLQLRAPGSLRNHTTESSLRLRLKASATTTSM
eukprot:COSAG01_NODE_65559_length_273_cov_0.568966_1_plen_75_part_01